MSTYPANIFGYTAPTSALNNQSLDSLITQLSVSEPTINTHVVNKEYADTLTAIDDITITRNGSSQLTVGNASIGPTHLKLYQDYPFTGKISGATPLTSNHLTTKQYVDQQISAVVQGTAQPFTVSSGLEFVGNDIRVRTTNVGIEIDSSNRVSLKDGGILPSKLDSTGTFTMSGLRSTNEIRSPFLCITTDMNQNTYALRHVSNNFATGISIDNQIPSATNSRLNICSSVPSGTYTSQLHVYSRGYNTMPDQSRMVIEANPTMNRIYPLQSGSGVNMPLDIYGALTCQTNGTVQFVNTTSTSVSMAGGLQVSGPISGTLSTASQPNITSVGTLSSLTVSGVLNGTLSTASQPNITSVGTLSGLTVSGTAVFTGAVTVPEATLSGHAVTKQYVDALALSATLNPSNVLSLTNTSQSTSTTTGALTVAGGVAIAKNLSVGGTTTLGANVPEFTPPLSIVTPYFTTTLQMQSSTDTITLDCGNTGFRINANSTTNILLYNKVSGTVSSSMTTESTSTSTGAHVMAGGLGVAKNLHVGGTLTVNSTVQSSSTTTGAVVVTGGVAVGGNVHIGGQIRRSSAQVINLGPSSSDFNGIYTTIIKVYDNGQPRNQTKQFTITYPSTTSNWNSVASWTFECTGGDPRADAVSAVMTNKGPTGFNVQLQLFNQNGNVSGDVYMMITVFQRP